MSYLKATDKNTHITYGLVTDEPKAKEIWEAVSPQKTLDDEWDFRYAFYKYLQFPLYFIVAYDGVNPVGLLPLQYNTGKGLLPESYEIKRNFFEFFGGDDTDSNGVLVKSGYEELVKGLFYEIPINTILAPLVEPFDNMQKSKIYTYKYNADLKNITTFQDFLMTHFDGKSRQKLTNRINKLERAYTIEISENQINDLEPLFRYNKIRFGNESSFHWQYRQEIFKDLMKLYPTDVFTIRLNNEIKAISYSIISKNVYSSMNIGYDYTIRDLGKLVIVSQIKRAIEKKCVLYDAGKGDSGWKEHFHLTKIPQYMQEVNIGNEFIYAEV